MVKLFDEKKFLLIVNVKIFGCFVLFFFSVRYNVLFLVIVNFLMLLLGKLFILKLLGN